jgi:transposase
MKKVMAGIDLHSNNLVIGIIDSEGKRLLHRKLDCQLNKVMALLGPYKQQLQTVAVESTYNWYWLVDGLRAAGYPTVLANPAKIDPYRGLKHADDQNDAFFLAQLARLRILPTGYIYEPQLRPVRDLLRRRLSLVHQRTALMLSFKSLFTRTTGQQMKLRRLKTLSAEEAKALYEHPANQLVAQVQHRHIQALKESIEQIEAVVLKAARALPYYARLTTLPGVGIILGLTITMETGDIQRFASPGEFASYCRTVDAQHTSNGKKKADNNQKCGNKYLAWAWVEAANFAKRYDPQCRRWFDRKAAKSSTVIATKALACKLAKAAWYLMAQNSDYDAGRMFAQQTVKTKQ